MVFSFCTLGIMGNALQFAKQNIADGIAADWHPTEKTNKKAATLLTLKIKQELGW